MREDILYAIYLGSKMYYSSGNKLRNSKEYDTGRTWFLSSSKLFDDKKTAKKHLKNIVKGKFKDAEIVKVRLSIVSEVKTND